MNPSGYLFQNGRRQLESTGFLFQKGWRQLESTRFLFQLVWRLLESTGLLFQNGWRLLESTGFFSVGVEAAGIHKVSVSVRVEAAESTWFLFHLG